MINIKGLGKTYISTDGTLLKTLDNLSFTVNNGEFTALIGPSGCGKSTLLKILAGLLPTDSGSIVWQGTKPSVGYMPQTDSLLPWRTVRENIELGLEIKKVPTNERRAISQNLIEQIGLGRFENSYPFELSGGMKRRVAFARIMAMDPGIILMDEPFGALDIQTRDMLEDDLLTIWNQTRKTILFVTHDLAEAIMLADRVYLMTSRPSTIKKEYRIDLPRPRNTEIRLSGHFQSILQSIWHDLSEEVKTARNDPYVQ